MCFLSRYIGYGDDLYIINTPHIGNEEIHVRWDRKFRKTSRLLPFEYVEISKIL